LIYIELYTHIVVTVIGYTRDDRRNYIKIEEIEEKANCATYVILILVYMLYLFFTKINNFSVAETKFI